MDVLCFTSSRVISSFGENPERGGRPASDNRISIVVVIKMGVFDQEVEISTIFVVEIDIRDRNIADVMAI